MLPRLFAPALLAFGALFGASAPAQANLLSNSSFEGPFVTNSYCYSCAAGGVVRPCSDHQRRQR